MNFERMWLELKNKAIQEIGRRELGPENAQRNKDLLELMSALRLRTQDGTRKQGADARITAEEKCRMKRIRESRNSRT